MRKGGGTVEYFPFLRVSLSPLPLCIFFTCSLLFIYFFWFFYLTLTRLSLPSTRVRTTRSPTVSLFFYPVVSFLNKQQSPIKPNSLLFLFSSLLFSLLLINSCPTSIYILTTQITSTPFAHSHQQSLMEDLSVRNSARTNIKTANQPQQPHGISQL